MIRKIDPKQSEREISNFNQKSAFIGVCLEQGLNEVYALTGDCIATEEFMTDPYRALIQPVGELTNSALKLFAATQAIRHIDHTITFDGEFFQVEVNN